MPRILSACLVAVLFPHLAFAQQPVPIRLASAPALSPDGKTVAFSWRGDLWAVAVEGGTARRLTSHPAEDGEPAFSPDGAEIAFTSDRGLGRQIFLMPAAGGEPRPLTIHTAGFSLQDWYPDGASLLARSAADTHWAGSARFWKIDRAGQKQPEMIFDDYGDAGRLSPDGKRMAFVREGTAWWRKGYRGSSAAQVWLYEEGKFRQVLGLATECRWPLWRADGGALWYCGAEDGVYNLRELDLSTGATRALTRFKEDAFVFPCVSRDGSTVVFRVLFDLYRFRPGRDAEPARIEISAAADVTPAPLERRSVAKADDLSFTSDGLEVAFVAGGDVWVMDTVLREPRQVTRTSEEERDPAFTADGNGIIFASDAGGRADLWRAERRDPAKYWWQNDGFALKKLTDDEPGETAVQPSPDGSRVAFVKGSGDLWTMKPDGTDQKRLFQSWNEPDYDWSPDGRWIAYALDDADFNRDIWIRRADGSNEPVNVSRHPDNEYGPAWSPDGRVLAFVGRRHDKEVDVWYVWLRREDDEKAKRERTLDEALEKMKKERKEGDGKPEERGQEKKKRGKGPDAVAIDFDLIHERVRRIATADVEEGGLFWKHDSKRLAFTASWAGGRDTRSVEFPEPGAPKTITAKTGTRARWVEADDQILWLSEGLPGMVKGNDVKAYAFAARQEVDLAARNRAAFLRAWRLMRDNWYDGRLNNRDWEAVRRKYEEVAASPDARALSDCVNLMLGELNGSHLGFYSNRESWRPPDAWQPATPWLGIRWDAAWPGPGLRIAEVVADGPADRATSKLDAGDVVVKIDGTRVDPGADLVALLNGPLDREIRLHVLDSEAPRVMTQRVKSANRVRTAALRPAGWNEVPGILYRKWVKDTRAKVDAASGGTLGYLHIRGMDWPSFQQFERELYAVGCGKDGLVIDVRENGGGFTADHLLTILTQPTHAVTVPRGGGPGYPQDRRVYATWDKPIVVLCNQNSFSNAEIFSHAVKTLKRGRVVGVPTAGGVISTGGSAVMDVGFLRMPTRGWFLRDTGQDMELNGCVPDIVLWPRPGEMPRGVDVQLDAAVAALLDDVKAWKAQPRPELKKASER
ncbi:MAG: PD40 domain-containing protein [Planctomycetes bacterium]|nr:PD40 domain-containing protein [Planctomycetota bacterium]